MSELGIDPAAVQGTAAALATSAGVLAECGRSLVDSEFDRHSAGRDYGEYGAAISAGLDRCRRVLDRSARGTADSAELLRATVGRYVEQDTRSAAALDRLL